MMSTVVGNSFYVDDAGMDANALLMEFDKGLRSKRAGEQCEAIVRFPVLIERYPFPILINTASLKVAEVFRDGSNFSRLLVLKVLQDCEKHLDKILNVDEFVRRLFFISHSNDPIARSITLRALGSIASIVVDRKNVHHCFRNSLDAADENEMNAAIEASACLARKSPEFAHNIYPKVLKMINESSASLEAKVLLLSVFHHSHYNGEIAMAVKGQLIQLLAKNQRSYKLTCALLHTITFIATTSLTQIPENIDLLLSYLKNDQRAVVRRQVLLELGTLARINPHLWSRSNVSGLIECLLTLDMQQCNSETFGDEFRFKIINIFSDLMGSPCLLSSEPEFFSKFLDQMAAYCFSMVAQNCSIKLSAVSIKFLVRSFTYNGKQSTSAAFNNLINLLISFINSTYTILTSRPIPSDEQFAYVMICKSLSHLLTVSNTKKLSHALCESLARENVPPFWVRCVCETLMTISKEQCLELNLDDIVRRIATRQGSTYCQESHLQILSLYFRTLCARSSPCPQDIAASVMNNRVSKWTGYRVIRHAMRYGHHIVAAQLCDRMCQSASSETIYFWLLSLSKIAAAESLLQYEHQKATAPANASLSRSINLYIEASSALKSSVTPSSPLTFQCEYVNLRCKLLQAHLQLREACKLIRSAPAPAVAATAASTRDDLLKCGTVVLQMRKCARELRAIAESYSMLYQSSFNADNSTLAHVQLMQSSCTIIAEAIESLFLVNRISSLFVNKDTQLELSRFSTSSTPSVEHVQLIAACRSISELVRNESAARTVSQIESAQIEMLLNISRTLLGVSLAIPRLFFQTVQNTCIKLAVSPQPKVLGELLTVNINSNFTLKAEGVIVVRKDVPVVRKVSKVMISVSANLVGKTTGVNDFINIRADIGAINIQSLATPVNDYFSQPFVLTFSESGLYNVTVEASIVDEADAQWKSGPVISTSIKVYDSI